MKTFLKKTIAMVIVLWLVISILRSFFNISKVFTEDWPWIFISDSQKKSILYGDSYPLAACLNKNIPGNNTALFISDDGMLFYLTRYLVYPVKLYWLTTNQDALQSAKKYGITFIVKTNEFKKRINGKFIISCASKKKTLAKIYQYE